MTRVEPGSKADLGGLMVGDQITSVNGKDVLNQGHFDSLLRQNFNARSLVLAVQRSGQTVLLTLKMIQ